MSTHRLSGGSPASSPPRLAAQRPYQSWTDDLPVCYLSGVGFATNQVYREDGFRQEEHDFEDRSIHFKTEENICLYAVFDGHDGSHVSHFAAQRMPAELLLGQLRDKDDGEEIKKILHDGFKSVDTGYEDSMDDLLAKRASLTIRIPENLTEYEALQQYPDVFQELESLNAKLIGGSTAVVALVHNEKLYTANVGCSRALLCQLDVTGVLRVAQLSVDHDLDNEAELERLQSLGADVQIMREQGNFGNFRYTRSLGDLDIKQGYKTLPGWRTASSVPLVSEPYVTDGIEIDNCCGFLILMSYGLYKTFDDAVNRENPNSGTENVNAAIASLVAGEFGTQSTLNGVAQAVVDKVVRLHHDTFMTFTGPRKERCQKRKDITLLVRNFNYPLPNAMNSPSSTANMSPLIGTATTGMETPLSVIIPQTSPTESGFRPFMYSQAVGSDFLTMDSFNNTFNSSLSSTYSTDDSTQSNQESLMRFHATEKPKLDLDPDGKIAAYVEFTDFFAKIDALTNIQKEKFDKETEPRPDYEPIPEDKELMFHNQGGSLESLKDASGQEDKEETEEVTPTEVTPTEEREESQDTPNS